VVKDLFMFYPTILSEYSIQCGRWFNSSRSLTFAKNYSVAIVQKTEDCYLVIKFFFLDLWSKLFSSDFTSRAICFLNKCDNRNKGTFFLFWNWIYILPEEFRTYIWTNYFLESLLNLLDSLFILNRFESTSIKLKNKK
jgi:hypothetical protein